ncbi:MAG: hypothetical protein AAF941_06190, partial [Pseudomonadota bacterium]
TVDEILESGDESKYSEIAESLGKLALDGDPDYAIIISDWLYYGRFGLKRDVAKSFEYLKIAVDALVPDAVHDYAQRINGDEPESEKEALQYFVLAAVLGDTDAIDALSDMLLYEESLIGRNDFVSAGLRKHRYLLISEEIDGDSDDEDK